MTMNSSWNSMSPTLNFSSTVLFEVSMCPFAKVHDLESWSWSLFNYLLGRQKANILEVWFWIATDGASASIRPSMVNSPNTIGKSRIRLVYLSPRFLERFTYGGSPSLVTRGCKKAVSSIRLFGLWFGFEGLILYFLQVITFRIRLPQFDQWPR